MNSMFDSVDNVQAKTPVDKSQLLNVASLKELVQSGAVHALLWVDTRDMFAATSDMFADAFTKGSISREAHPTQDCSRLAASSQQTPLQNQSRCA
eukprot:2910117-Amphidinium_carterae.1